MQLCIGSSGDDAPFLTCGRSTSRSCIRCLIRPVTPRDETMSTLSFRFFCPAGAEVDAAATVEEEPFISTSPFRSASDALPLPLFLDACLRMDAMFV